MTSMATTAAAQTAARYDSIIERIRSTVDRTNRELGIDLGDWSSPKISFGYIGNIPTGAAPGGASDDRMWSIYLPHPGRVGTDQDRIGFFRTGDESGALAALNAFVGFRRGLRWSGGPEMAMIRYAKAARMATDDE